MLCSKKFDPVTLTFDLENQKTIFNGNDHTNININFFAKEPPLLSPRQGSCEGI
jgi:hypothetical protein